MADGSQSMDTFTPGPDSARALRHAFGQFATGVTLITIKGPDGPMGFVANSFSSLSLDPALVLWALGKSSRRYDHFAHAPHFALHILSAAQSDFITRFKRDGIGFVGLDHLTNAQDVPMLEGALARFECRQYATHDGGDHTIILGQVQRVTLHDGAPLIFAQGRMQALPTENHA